MRDRFLVVELSKPHGATCMKPCDKETRLRISHAEVAVFSRMPQDRCYQLRVPDHDNITGPDHDDLGMFTDSSATVTPMGT